MVSHLQRPTVATSRGWGWSLAAFSLIHIHVAKEVARQRVVGQKSIAIQVVALREVHAVKTIQPFVLLCIRRCAGLVVRSAWSTRPCMARISSGFIHSWVVLLAYVEQFAEYLAAADLTVAHVGDGCRRRTGADR